MWCHFVDDISRPTITGTAVWCVWRWAFLDLPPLDSAAATTAALENFRRLSKIHPQGSKGIFLIIICSIISIKRYIYQLIDACMVDFIRLPRRSTYFITYLCWIPLLTNNNIGRIMITLRWFTVYVHYSLREDNKHLQAFSWFLFRCIIVY